MLRGALVAMVLTVMLSAAGQTQRDGGIGVDSKGNEVLESIHIPSISAHGSSGMEFA